MSDAPEPEREIFPIAEAFGEIRMFPRPVVWTAGLIILALAMIGLIQGVRGSISSGAANGGQGEQPSADAVSAQAAAPLPQNIQWSALNGPAMSSAAPAKATSTEPPASSSAAAESDEPQSGPPAVSAAASAAAPPPVSAAPPAITPPPAADSGQAPASTSL